MILACQKIEKAFGGKSVLNNVNFLINEGEKAAVIGINGAGKTTLFKIITGEYEADNGEVIFQKGSTYGYLSQVIDVSSHRSIYEEMLDAKKEIIEMEKKIRQLEKDISTLSGEALESAMESYSRLTDRFTIKILTSYNNHIGSDTNNKVNTSDVGVIIAATTRMITTA